MRRQHFGMCINIDSGSLGLAQKHFQIAQVMAGNKNTGPCSDANADARDFRISVGFGVSLVQQRHASHPVFAGFEREGNQLVRGQAVIQRRRKRLLQKSIRFGIIVQKRIGMLRIG